MLKSTYDRYKHLINTQINKWTVLGIVAHQIQNRDYAFATCKCVCGTVRDVRLHKLLSSACLDCGCGHRARLKEATIQKYSYLIGSQINAWTCLNILPPDECRRKTYVLCKCTCGTVKEVQLTYLLNSNSKDCGCGRKESLSRLKTKDFAGQRFGKLTVLEKLPERDKHGHTIYKCICDCGNTVNVLGNSLSTNHTASCGCLVSYWNMYIQKLLEKYKLEYKAEFTVYIGNTYYRYDFYLPQYNLMIEYDGEQHFKPVCFFGTEADANEAFRRTQEHDKIKNQYCAQNNINLLRIPYWETKNIETTIKNHLQRLSTEGSVSRITEYATV